MKRKMHPNSLANLWPPWKKGEVANPRGINNRMTWQKFLNRIAGEIARQLRADGPEARVTPEMVALVFVRKLLPRTVADEGEREKALAEVLPLFERAMRR